MSGEFPVYPTAEQIAEDAKAAEVLKKAAEQKAAEQQAVEKAEPDAESDNAAVETPEDEPANAEQGKP